MLEKADEERGTLLDKAKKGVRGPVAKTHYYWDEGLHIVSGKEIFGIKIGGKLMFDGGYIGTDDELQRAFPDLEGGNADFRELSISASGVIRLLSPVEKAADSTKEVVPRISDPSIPKSQCYK